MASLVGRVGVGLSRRLLRNCGLEQRAVVFSVSVPNVRQFSTANNSEYTVEYYNGLVKDKPLVVFMKGDPSAPMCGFSRLVVQILHMHGLEKYDHYNVLEDVDFKEGMKKYSNWPTFPQVYLDGELVGGADILLQMHQSGDLIPELQKIGHNSSLLDSQRSETT